MADIQFDEEQQFQQGYQVEQTPFFIRLVLATGIVSTDKQAQYLLLGLAVVAILISIYVALPSAPKATINHQIGDELRVINAATR
jgi:hypothetical protein